MPTWVSGAEEGIWVLGRPPVQQNGHSTHLFWAGEARSPPTWPSLCSLKWVCDFLWPLGKAAQYGGDRLPAWIPLASYGTWGKLLHLCVLSVLVGKLGLTGGLIS